MMNDEIYYRLMEMYFYQCGEHTGAWLPFVMEMKWQFLSQGGW